MKGLLRHFLILSLAVSIGGCKLAIVVIEGGEVQSEDWGTCTGGTVCIIDITDTGFGETFYAAPEDGWYFHAWNSGDNLLCAGSANPVCELALAEFAEIEAIESLVESSETFFLMPIFKDYPRSTTVEGEPRTILVDGEEWEWMLPTDSLLGYSYDQVREVCPEGICSGNLPGSSTDLTGYIWASSNDLSLLLMAYPNPESLFRDWGWEGELGEAAIWVMLSDPLGLSSPREPGQLESCNYVATIWVDFWGIDCVTVPADQAPWFYRPSG